MIKRIFLALCWLGFISTPLARGQDVTVVKPPGGGDPHFGFALENYADERGNRIPDFSSAGYMANAVAIPDAPVRLVVPAVEGDDGARIQAALDQIAAMEPDEHGVRGAVLLEASTYEVGGQLILKKSGVVLRGQGPGEGGTVIKAMGKSRRVLIRILGEGDLELLGKPLPVSGYIPVGARKISVKGALDHLDANDRIMISRPSPEDWLNAAGMLRTWNIPKAPRAWRPGELDIRWDRGVDRRSGSELELDAPITMALDPDWGGATVQGYRWPGRINQSGVENLRLVS